MIWHFWVKLVPNFFLGKVVTLLIGSSYALMHNQVHIQNLLDIRTTLVKAYNALREGPSTFTWVGGDAHLPCCGFFKIKKSMILIILKNWVKKMQILALFCLVQLECTLQSTFFFHYSWGISKKKCMLQWTFYFLKFLVNFFSLPWCPLHIGKQ